MNRESYSLAYSMTTLLFLGSSLQNVDYDTALSLKTFNKAIECFEVAP